MHVEDYLLSRLHPESLSVALRTRCKRALLSSAPAAQNWMPVIATYECPKPDDCRPKVRERAAERQQPDWAISALAVYASRSHLLDAAAPHAPPLRLQYDHYTIKHYCYRDVKGSECKPFTWEVIDE